MSVQVSNPLEVIWSSKGIFFGDSERTLPSTIKYVRIRVRHIHISRTTTATTFVYVYFVDRNKTVLRLRCLQEPKLNEKYEIIRVR